MRELLTYIGAVASAATSGTFALYTNHMYVTGSTPYVPVPVIVIPFGLRAKIWGIRISSTAATQVSIQYSPNASTYYTGGSPTWATVDSELLSSPGDLVIEFRRPVVLASRYGTEGFQIIYTASAAVQPVIEVDVEFTEEDE